MHRRGTSRLIAQVGPLLIVALYGLELMRAVFAPTVAASPPGQVSAGSLATAAWREPAPLRVVDMSVLTYDLPVAGRVDHLVAVNQGERERADSVGLNRLFPALDRLSSVRNPVNPEELIGYRPNAVFVSSDWIDPLREFGFPGLIELTYDPRSSQETKLATWRLLGKITRGADRAGHIAAAYQARREELRTSLREQSVARAAILVGGPGTWSIAGDGYYLNQVIAAAKGVNVAGSDFVYPRVDLEQLAALDPPVIFLNSQPGDHAVPLDLYRNPYWQVLRAVRERRVYKLPRFAVFLGPAEEPLFLRWVAEVLHPSLPARFRSEYRSAYETTYGYTPTEREIDSMIHVDANAGSADYQRFLSAAG